MDRLIAELQSETPGIDPDAKVPADGQDATDRPIAEAGDATPATGEAAQSLDARDDSGDEGARLDQNDLDLLLAQMAQDEAADDGAVAGDDPDRKSSAAAPAAAESDFAGLTDEEAELDGDAAPVQEEDLPESPDAKSEHDDTPVAADEAPVPGAGKPPIAGSPEEIPPLTADADAETEPVRRRRAEALKEKNKRPRPSFAVLLGIFLVFIAAGLGAVGYRLFLGRHRRVGPAVKARPVVTSPAVPAARPAPTPSAPAVPERPPAAAPLSAVTPETGTISQDGSAEPSPIDPINFRFQTIDTIRQELLAKRDAILKLKEAYGAGIRRVEKEVRGLIAKNRVHGFREAQKVDGIVFDLRTIRRRETIIRQLADPLNRLEQSSEALLYARRRAEIDLLLVDQARGVGIDRIRESLDDEIARDRIDIDNLLPAGAHPSDERLENVWKTVVRNLSSRSDAAAVAAVRKALAAAVTTLSNQEIWQQMEAGNFDNAFRLTALSEDAAQVLATWKGKELFLDRLTDLSPEAAWQLSRWKGDWLGLNGLTDMSGDTVNALAQWSGRRLSLNGFKEFPAQVARYLATWRGEEIELMGLDRLSATAARYLSQWRGPGRRLYVPDRFWRPRTENPDPAPAAAGGPGNAARSQ